MKVLTTILFLSMAASLAIAQDDLILEEEEEIRRYTVELIVFFYAENVSVGTEIFPPDEPIVDDVLSPDQGQRAHGHEYAVHSRRVRQTVSTEPTDAV
jgi:hypothetical protein